MRNQAERLADAVCERHPWAVQVFARYCRALIKRGYRKEIAATIANKHALLVTGVDVHQELHTPEFFEAAAQIEATLAI